MSESKGRCLKICIVYSVNWFELRIFLSSISLTLFEDFLLFLKLDSNAKRAENGINLRELSVNCSLYLIPYELIHLAQFMSPQFLTEFEIMWMLYTPWLGVMGVERVLTGNPGEWAIPSGERVRASFGCVIFVVVVVEWWLRWLVVVVEWWEKLSEVGTESQVRSRSVSCRKK